jgi:hypothetical protein
VQNSGRSDRQLLQLLQGVPLAYAQLRMQQILGNQVNILFSTFCNIRQHCTHARTMLCVSLASHCPLCSQSSPPHWSDHPAAVSLLVLQLSALALL